MPGKPSSEDPRPEFPSESFVQWFRRTTQCVSVAVWILLYASLTTLLVSHYEAVQRPMQQALQFVEVHSVGVLLVGLVALFLMGYVTQRRRGVYLRDFAVYKPPEELKVCRSYIEEAARASGRQTEASISFQSRVAARAGLGDETYLPPAHHHPTFDTVDMDTARHEAEMVMYGAMEQLMKQSGLEVKDIDILIVNCSLFNPTPSLSAMMVNHFKMRSDICTYNLSGMGCSAGVIAVGLARELLQVYPNKNAVVISTENVTQNWYLGNDRSMLIPNVLFRMGASAAWMTNKPSERRKAKYMLQHVIRVHLGAEDKAFRCVYQHPDAEGVIGVELNKDLLSVASKALTVNMTRIGPRVLPWSEQLFVAMNIVARRLLKYDVRPYVPDFQRAFQHFCLHAGGRAVIEGIAKQLRLPPCKTDPSFQTLHWYGNTSSSSIWYALAYAETCQSVKKGDVVWQIGFGSGFKCNSAVWKATRNVQTQHKAWQHRIGKEPAPILSPISETTPQCQQRT